MKKNLYYRTVFRRRNVLKEALFDFFLSLASYPRMLIEVFIRSKFGERYFALSTALTIFGLLLVMPFLFEWLFNLWRWIFPDRHDQYYQGSDSFWGIVRHNVLWYVFAVAFLFKSIGHHREQMWRSAVFDFKHFSLYSGDIDPRLAAINAKLLARKSPFLKGDIRFVEMWLEPGLFFAAGLVFWLFGSSLGNLLLVSSVIYSLSYAAAYNQGDHFVMDKIDEMICNEELVHAFVDELDPSETRGVRFYGRRPIEAGIRRKLVESFVEDSDDAVEAK
jgi:hypothetical protein